MSSSGLDEGKRRARRCLLAGVIMVAITLAFLPWNPARTCEDSSVPPMLGFELAISVADLRTVFGAEGACRASMEHALRVENWIDFAYMASYGAFLFLGLAALRARGDSPALRLAAIAAVAAPLADVVENVCLLSMDVDAPGSWLPVLMVASRTKFLLLGLVSLAIGVATWRTEVGARRLLALPHFPALPVMLAGAVWSAAVPAVMPAGGASWLALIVWASIAGLTSASASLRTTGSSNPPRR
jgi:hypothetical protein